MEASVESLIRERAGVIAEQMVAIAQVAESEEDVRHEVNSLLDEFLRQAGIKVRARHEYGLAGGRVDSKYGGVIVEYKAAKGPDRITTEPDAPGTRKAIEQVKQRFRDFESHENVGRDRLFGVACDGDTLVFVRCRGGQFEVEAPQPATAASVERLLRALVSLGAAGLSYTPEQLAGHFGADSPTAQEGVRRIYAAIAATESAKAQTFFGQWKILFGEVCGYDVEGRSPKVEKLAAHYGVAQARPDALLFAVHTYYAVFMKLLAAEIVSSFTPLGGSPVKKCVAASTSAALQAAMAELEQGGIWSQLGLTNFLEGDLFSWYIAAWDGGLEQVVRGLVGQLDKFDPTTLSVEPAESRDLLKKLYQDLFPKSVRHDLGEYYTPDWLAEFTLNELGYDGDPDRRLLDPACGSGTFLVMAIGRVLAWFAEHRHTCGFGEGELLQKIRQNVVGFDLNPLAVMAARTNYLMAVRGLLQHAAGIEIPVYLCDSILTPGDYGGGGLLGGETLEYRSLQTAVGELTVPADIAASGAVLAEYAELLEQCVRNRYASGEFVQRCRDRGLPLADDGPHERFYKRLADLDAENRNGIWARIIKNAFAPLFVGRFDYVAGNPPWVNWEHLPAAYRDAMKPLWQDYGLFSLGGTAGRLGGGKKDLSMLLTYAAVDNYLADDGRLGFVITQTVFKTKGAGDGFRRLQFGSGRQTVHLRPVVVHDLSAMQVFEGASNSTAVVVVERAKSGFAYPVPYRAWRGPGRVAQDSSLEEVLAATERRAMGAIPVEPGKETSPWLTAPAEALPGLVKLLGPSDYTAHAGCCTWLNGAFWLRVLERLPSGELLIENLWDVGKIKVEPVQAVIEPDLVHPLLRGRDVGRWRAEPSAHIILTQDVVARAGIAEGEMRRRWPKTFAYLKRFEEPLRQRSGYRKYFKPSDPFYSMYNVGPYTLAPIRVLWRQFLPELRMTVVDHARSASTKPPLTQHVVSLVACGCREEAAYLTGCGNSSPANLLHSLSSTGKSYGSPGVLKQIRIPAYEVSAPAHRRLAALSEQAHAAAARGAEDEIPAIEAAIDAAAAALWGITPDELAAIQAARRGMSGGGAGDDEEAD